MDVGGLGRPVRAWWTPTTAAGMAAVPFLGLLLAVQARHPGLHRIDRGIADGLNAWALQHPDGVTLLLFLESGLSPNAFRLLVLVVAVRLWRAGSHRLACWAVVTMASGAVAGVVLKALVSRARPSFVEPVAAAGSSSFPSVHALTSLLAAGVLLLLALPVLDGAARTAAWAVAVGVVLLTGLDRVALGVHFTSDVLAGWSAAGAVLVGTTGAFAWWRGAPRPPDQVSRALLLRSRRPRDPLHAR